MIAVMYDFPPRRPTISDTIFARTFGQANRPVHAVKISPVLAPAGTLAAARGTVVSSTPGYPGMSRPSAPAGLE